MKQITTWKPSKFVYLKGKLRASSHENEVSVSSQFVADLVAAYYDFHIKSHVTGKVVDLGCGKVPLYETYKPYATDVICADWESSIHKNPFLDVICDLNKSLPFSSEEFDTIILSDVLEHIAKPEDLWKEMNRILRPGGKVILNVPFFYKLHEIPNDYFRYTKFALRNFAETSGFEILVLKEMGGLPEILTDLIAKLFFPVPIIGRILSIIVQRIGGLIGRTNFGKQLSQKTKEHFPLGYFMIVQKKLNQTTPYTRSLADHGKANSQ